MADSSSTVTDEWKEEEGKDEQQCYVCWDNIGTDENPIRRDCGCKGTAGWVHVKCLIESAEITGRVNLLDPLLRPWRNCSQCLKPYEDPTKSSLMKALIGDRPRLSKRVFSSIGSTGKELIFHFLLLLAMSCARYLFEYSAEKVAPVLGPWLASMWNDSREELQVVIFFASSIVLCKVVYHYRWQIQRILGTVATVVGAVVVIEVVPDNSVYSMTERVAALGGSLLVLAFLAYRARAEIRHQAIQIRRRPLATLLGLSMVAVLLFLQYHIEYFLGTMYSKHVENDIDIDEVISGLVRRLLFEGRISIRAYIELDPAVERIMTPIREDYWYCCAS